MPILNWVDKDKALKAADGAPYRLLEEVADLSHGESSADISISAKPPESEL